MAATFTLYDVYYRDLAAGTYVLTTADIQLMILDTSYTPDIAAHVSRNDLVGEIVGAGYTAGGKPLTGKLITLDTVANVAKFKADDVIWDPVTFTNGRYAVLYKSSGGMAVADPLIGVIDFGADENKSAAQFGVHWDGGVVFTVGV